LIISTTNGHVKHIRSLIASRRKRDNERCFVVEGVRLMAEALSTGCVPEVVLYAPDQLATTNAGLHLLDQLDGLPNCYEANSRVIAAAADTVTPQGVVGVVSYPQLSPRPPGLWLVLDEVQDPGNVGTLLRSAESAGVGLVLCSQGTADVYSPKVVRSAMGAHFYLPLRSGMMWDEIAATLRDVPAIYAAVADARKPYYAVDWCEQAALIVGNEAQGICDEGLALATEMISIPMLGRVGSLNASVAGSVILFEAMRQRYATHGPTHGPAPATSHG
jgi:TrmH family RNA methyltransferase